MPAGQIVRSVDNALITWSVPYRFCLRLSTGSWSAFYWGFLSCSEVFSRFPASSVLCYMHDNESNRALQRDAFTMKETAAKLGISYMSVFRLAKRGFLKPCVAMRIKLFSQREIDRFLKEGQAL